MKTKEELQELKKEYETLNQKLAELTEDELKQVVGGFVVPTYDPNYAPHTYFDKTTEFEQNTEARPGGEIPKDEYNSIIL